jgi:FMN phosphatase YigB (HAD superfamily)
MTLPGRRRLSLLAAALLAGLSTAPAPSPEPPKPTSLADARHRAALKQYELTWSYFQQARIDSYQVYVWSRLVLDSRRDLADQPADRITAIEDHLTRMKKLEELIKKVRRLGFGSSYDVGASEYYRLEAEYWLAQARLGR